jgi:hypothetical protein
MIGFFAQSAEVVPRDRLGIGAYDYARRMVLVSRMQYNPDRLRPSIVLCDSDPAFDNFLTPSQREPRWFVCWVSSEHRYRSALWS